MTTRLSNERMAEISEDVVGAAMLALWNEAMRARESEAQLRAELRALGTALRNVARELSDSAKAAIHLGESES